MAKRRRQAKIPTLAWERPRGAIGQRVMGRPREFYGAVGVVLVILVVLGIFAFAFGSEELEKRRRPGSTAVQVEDTRFRLDYFSDRLTMFVNRQGGPGEVQPLSALPAVSDLLIREEIVRRFAGEFDLTATEDEIQEAIVSDVGVPADDEIFDVTFQDRLALTGLSEQDYRLMIEATVLTEKLQQHFEEEVPESAESVLYRQILVSEQAAADDIKQQIEDGADFAALAAEDSNLDVANKENGGEVGWVARGVLNAEEDIFALEPGEVGTVSSPAGVFVIEMLEKAEDRKIEDDQRELLAASALADWVQEKRETLAIVSSVVPGAASYDPTKADWAVSRAYTQPEIPVPVQ